MKSDRLLIELASSQSLDAIADRFRRPPISILKKASRLGLSINRGDSLKKPKSRRQ
jgi:hypothetical protein